MIYARMRDVVEILKTEMPIRGGGWFPVKDDIVDALVAALPYVTLQIEDDIVVGFEPAEQPPEPEPQPSAEEDRDAMLIDLEYRMTLLELGAN